MPISGLVIVLNRDDDAERVALESIRANPSFTLATGHAAGRVPTVLETSTDAESRTQLDWVRSLPGVAMVEVAYVNFANTKTEERIVHGS